MNLQCFNTLTLNPHIGLKRHHINSMVPIEIVILIPIHLLFQFVKLKLVEDIGAIDELAIFAITLFAPALVGVMVTKIEKHFLNYLGKPSIAFRIYS